jgi:carbonic anhydrase
MKGALDYNSLDSLPHVQDWLGHVRGALSATLARCHCSEVDVTDDAQLRMLTEENILQQLQHMRTHPAVAAKLATKEIRIHGWLYDIGTGEVFSGDEATREFSPV